MNATLIKIPSLVPDQLVVRIEKGRSGDPEVVATGSAQFVKAEWEALTAESRSKLRSGL